MFLIDWSVHRRDGVGVPVSWISSWGISEEEMSEVA